ncbi:helix-turn-helix domain-containing protein [Alistipes shahii]|jgi:hypothetical protein|nr:helix-turn-helix domain-containing protein [Alistipes shahii]
MKPLKGNPTLRLLRLVLRRFNRLELLIQNNSRPLPDDLIDTPAVRMLTRMSDRTLSRRRSDGTIPYVKHGGKIYYSRSRVLEALRNEPNTTSTNKVKKSRTILKNAEKG